MLMSELGFKYPNNSLRGAENIKRIGLKPTTADDSQMFVYDAFYGVEMVDAIIQNLKAGYNGITVWNMDDAMYDDGHDKLKRWGFWNILGSEKFGDVNDENIRPWFYTMSLLCRYVPKGSAIYNVQLPDKKGLQAFTASKDGRNTIVVSNSHATTYELKLKSSNNLSLNNAKFYSYIADDGAVYEAKKDGDGFAIPIKTETLSLDNNNGLPITIQGNSVVIITTME